MGLTKVAGTCEDGPCPTAFRTDSGEWIFQGFKVTDPETLAALNLPENEIAVRLPDALVLPHEKVEEYIRYRDIDMSNATPFWEWWERNT